MFKSKTFIGLSIVLCVIFSSCEFFNTSVPDWFREYTDYPSVSDTSWAGKGKKDSSGVINVASSEDFTVTLRLNNAQQFKFTAGENMTLSLPQPLKDAGLNISAVKIKQDESDLSKIIITYPADFLRAAEIKGGSNKFDISPEVILKHPKIGIDFCTYNSLKVICNSAPARPSGSVLYKDTSDSKYVICFNMPDKNTMKNGAQDSDIKSIQINGTDYPITISADGTFDFNPPNSNFKQGVSPSSADSNYQQVDSSSPAFIKNGQPVYFKTDDAVGSHPVYKIEVFDKTIGSGAVTVSADMLRLKNPSVQQKDSFGTFTNLASDVNNIPVSDDGSTASVYITPPSEYEGGSPVQDVSVIYELWRGHDTASDRILSGTVEAAQTVVSVPGGKTLLRVYAHKDGAMDSAVTEYKISVDAYVYYVKGEGASELSGTAADTNEGTKSYPFATVKAAIQRINDEGSSTTPYTVYVDGSAQETAAISVGGNGGGTTARKVQIKRYGSGTAGFGRKDATSPSGTLLTVEKDSELTLNGITLDGKNIVLAADEIVTRGNTVFEGCTVQNYTAETKRVLYVENGNCTISNTVMQGAASLTPQGYVYVNKTAAESPVFTVKGSVKIGGAGDLTSVVLGCYEDSSHNWNSAFVNADGLNAGSYINLVPSKYDKQSGKTLVKGSGASSYKDYFHIAGNSDDGGHYLLEAGDDGGINNALILKKSIIISGGDENAWAKLKYNAERANDGEVIVVTGTIKASNSTATINSTSVNNFGDIVITKKVTIRAKDETGAIIDANKTAGGKTAHRIFKADGAGAELTLQNIKLQGGIAEGASESGYGGALYVKGGAALVLDKCVVTDNSASAGGGIYLSATSKLKNGSSRIVPSADKAAGKNDVYLAKDTYIELTDISGSGVIAQISPELRLSGIKIAEYTGITSAPSNIASRFAVTSTADGVWILKYNVSSKEFNLYQTAVYGDGNDIAWAQLRAAAANSATGDVITAKGIIKASNTQLHGTTENNYGEITVTKKITVKGEAGAVIDANKDVLGGAADRIFNISESGAELNLQSINLKNGKSSLSGGAISVSGGAKLNLSAGVSITNCSAAFGGAVYASGSGTEVVIDGAHLKADTASDEGSAIHLSDSALAEVKGESIIHGNHVAGVTSPSSVYLKGGARFTLGGKAKISNESGKNGSGVFINGAEFTMSGNAEISGNSTTSSGGGVHIEGTGGKFNMTGGTVSGNTAVSGGGVYIASGCEFNMSGGIVKDNKAVHTSSTQCKGGGVFLAGKFNMSGGIISGNEAKKSDTEYGDGGGVYTENIGAELKMSGGARIVPSADKKSGKNDVYINADKLIYITGELTGTEKVACITPKTYLAGTELVKWMGSGNMPSGYAGRFDLTSNGGIWELLLRSDNKTFILNQPSAVIDGDNGGTWAQLKNAVETAVDNKEIIIKGKIKAAYGDEEIKVRKQITIKPQSGTPIIDADKTNQGANVHRIFRVVSGASLTLKNIDLRNGKAATGGTSDVTETNTKGGAIYVESGATLTMENGRIGDCTAAHYGGAIANLGTLNLSGVSFESNEAVAFSGGAIYNDGSGSIQAVSCIFGGRDTLGNKAHKDGGAIAVNGSSAGEIKIKYGTISHNEAKNGKGGGIYSGSAITIEGTGSSRSEISSNKAKENGGGIYTSARLDITYLNNNDNTANGNGGGIYADAGSECTIKNSTMSRNTSMGSGGGLHVSDKTTTVTQAAKCKLDSTEMTGNKAKSVGGGAIYSAGTLEIVSCTLGNVSIGNDSNSAEGTGLVYGGAVYIFGGSCKLKDTTVQNNKIVSNGKGSGIYLNYSAAGSDFTVQGNTKIFGVTDSVMLGTTVTSTSLIKADGLTTGANINISPANSDTQKNAELVTGPGAAGYAQYFHLTGLPSSDEWSLKPNAGDNGLVLRKQETIDSSNGGTWKKLKDAIAAAEDGDVIKIIGEIKATSASDNSGEIEVKKNITIQGKKTDRTDTLNANKDDFGTAPFRIFKVEAGKKLTLENLTLKGGRCGTYGESGGGAIYAEGPLTMKNCIVTDNRIEYGNGGGICAESTLTMESCTVNGNTAADDGGVGGGGIYATGTLTMQGCTISGNYAKKDGGGIYAVGELSLTDCTVTANESQNNGSGSGSGGGIYIKGRCTMTGGSVTGNKANSNGNGGGIYIDGNGSFTMTGGTVSNNTTEYGDGGGIYIAENGSFTMTGGAVSSNATQQSGSGGGIFVSGTSAQFTMKDSAYITPSSAGEENRQGKNDVYLYNNAKIMLSAALTGTAPVARITVPHTKYASTTQVLDGAAVGTEYSKFTVTPKTVSGGTQIWKIKNDGYLQKPPVEINGSDTLVWKKLKAAIAAADDGDIIKIIGEIKATNDTDNSGELEISKNLTIKGRGTAAALDANKDGVNHPSTKHRIFKVTSGKTLTLQDLTLKGGEAGKYDSSDPLASSGGAIRLNGGSALLLNVTISGCKAITTGGCTGQGGGIYAEDGGTLTLNNSTIKDCEATDSGGGIYATGGTINLTNCNLRGCKAIKGGGIRLYKSSGGDATLTVSGGEIGGIYAGEPNTASGTSGNGGGISVEGGSCTVTLKDNAKITGNTANNGGGVYAENIKTFTLKNAEISSNTAMIGGGIYATGSSSVFTMENGSIIGNKAEYTGSTASNTPSGGGVYLRGGVTFTMKGGKITSSILFAPSTPTPVAKGGGVFIKDNGTKLILEDSAEISGNSLMCRTDTSKANFYGGGVYVEGGAEFTLKDSAVKNNKMTTYTVASSSAKGGGVYVTGSGSTFIVEGTSEISGNEVKHGEGSPDIPTWGGGVCLESSATFTMKNGTVKNNNCIGTNTNKCVGGGVYAASHAQFNFEGGTVSGNSAGIGKGVYIQYFTGTAYMTMSGGAKVDSNNDVYLGSAGSNPAFITVTGALSNSPAATLTMDNIAGYAEGREVVKGGVYTLTTADIARFPITAQTSQEWTTELSDNALKLKKSGGGTTKTINGSDSDAWTKLKTEVENPSGSAKITIQGTILAKPAHKGEITVSREVEIEGNGTDAVLNADVNNRIFKVNTAGKLTIKNLKLTGGLSNGAALQSENYGGAIYNEGELTVISCEMSDNSAEHSGGGAIYVKQGGKCTIKGTGARKTIIARNEASKGGGIQTDGECTVDEYTVIGGSAGDANKGKQFAGGILVGSTGKCTIKGGVEISHNTFTETSGTKGGGIYVEESSGNKGELILEGSAGKTVTIKENKATKGAGIFCEGKVVSMKYTEIKNCIAARNGGGIYLKDNATVKMGDNAEITDCLTENENYGGGVYVDSAACTFEMTGSAKVTVSTGVDKNKEGMNEIFLKDGVIKVTGTLTAGDGQAGRISVMSSKYETSTEVLTGDNLPTNSGKFRVTKQKIPNQAWKVSPSGKLQKN
ncbi:MAG: right-handed parallel beta-helix repeat-containing protein [Treponema sp.]